MSIACLPGLVQEAISQACQSDKQLSWKVQENASGLLIQLVWKAAPADAPRVKPAGNNWKHVAVLPSSTSAPRRRRNLPSRQRRSAQRMAAFLRKKELGYGNSTGKPGSETPAPCTGKQRTPAASPSSSKIPATRTAGSSCSDGDGKDIDVNVRADVTPEMPSLAVELKDCKDIDYACKDDLPGLRYTTPEGHLKWTPVVAIKNGEEQEFDVLDPAGEPKNLSFARLNGQPFLCSSYSPSSRVYTPIARRTRARLK